MIPTHMARCIPKPRIPVMPHTNPIVIGGSRFRFVDGLREAAQLLWKPPIDGPPLQPRAQRRVVAAAPGHFAERRVDPVLRRERPEAEQATNLIDERARLAQRRWRWRDELTAEHWQQQCNSPP